MLQSWRNAAGSLIDRETVVIPAQTAGQPAYIEEDGQIGYSIGSLNIPLSATPGESYVVSVTVDPETQNFNGIIEEGTVNDTHDAQTGSDAITINNTASIPIQTSSG